MESELKLLTTYSNNNGCFSSEFHFAVFHSRSLKDPFSTLSQENKDFLDGSQLTNEQKINCYYQIINYESVLIDAISEKLESHHNSGITVQAWRGLIGNWLRYAISIVYYRYETFLRLQKLEKNFLYSADGHPKNLKSSDTESFIWNTSKSAWLEALDFQILSFMNLSSIEIRDEPKSFDSAQSEESLISKNFKMRKFLNRSLHNFENQISRFSKNQEYFFYKTYLPRSVELRLNLLLKQVPVLRRDKYLPGENGSIDLDLRKLIFDNQDQDSSEFFIRLFLQLLPFIIPMAFVEDFVHHKRTSEKLKWPIAPKVIFTSNAFQSDEVFKIWTARMQSKGSKYVAGQHGNNYGAHKHLSPFPEEMYPDYFLTWGWKNENKKYIPTFILKDFKTTEFSKFHKEKKQILLIEEGLSQNWIPWDTVKEFREVHHKKINFVNLLLPDVKNKLNVRLHRIEKFQGLGEYEAWNENCQGVQISRGTSNIKKERKKSLLVIHGYDSTGMLETLAADIPSIMLMFGNDGFEYLNDSFRNLYLEMQNVGLIYQDPITASHFINNNFKTLTSWWNQKKIQNVKNEVLNSIARVENSPAMTLKNIFTQINNST